MKTTLQVTSWLQIALATFLVICGFYAFATSDIGGGFACLVIGLLAAPSPIVALLYVRKHKQQTAFDELRSQLAELRAKLSE